MSTSFLKEKNNNKRYLHRQAQFESKVRSYPRKLPLRSNQPQALGLLMWKAINT